MKITPIKTHKITVEDTDLLQILNRYLPKLKERSIVAITSKIISICEGAVVPKGILKKQSLVEKEADLYLPLASNKYGFHLTIKNGTMIASAGIDESNGNGFYVLWPRNMQKTVNGIRSHLVRKHKVKNLGVIIVDSKTTPLRWGTVGTTLAYSGFSALNNYVGKKDLFNYRMRVTRSSIYEGLGASTVLAMGEGAESTPIAIVEDTSFVRFQRRNPTSEELKSLSISIEDDVFALILTKAKWISGKKKAK